MATTETWLQKHKDGELAVDGYKLFRGYRKRVKNPPEEDSVVALDVMYGSSLLLPWR